MSCASMSVAPGVPAASLRSASRGGAGTFRPPGFEEHGPGLPAPRNPSALLGLFSPPAPGGPSLASPLCDDGRVLSFLIKGWCQGQDGTRRWPWLPVGSAVPPCRAGQSWQGLQGAALGSGGEAAGACLLWCPDSDTGLPARPSPTQPSLAILPPQGAQREDPLSPQPSRRVKPHPASASPCPVPYPAATRGHRAWTLGTALARAEHAVRGPEQASNRLGNLEPAATGPAFPAGHRSQQLCCLGCPCSQPVPWMGGDSQG